jgi:pyroglutamyl-peptidase
MGWIDARRERFAADVELRTAIIPTSWEAAVQFAHGTLANFDPDIALLFGIHHQASGFRIEKRARNFTGTQADNDGKRRSNSRLAANAPHILHATLNADKLATCLLLRNLPAATSTDAGGYLCNALLFLSLNQGVSRPRIRQTGFIHIPPLATPLRAKFGRFDKNTLIAGTEAIIDHCVGTHRYLARTGHS